MQFEKRLIVRQIETAIQRADCIQGGELSKQRNSDCEITLPNWGPAPTTCTAATLLNYCA